MVCVATEYGESLLPQGEYLELSHERLDEKQMEERMLQMENGLVIDATHPYAQVVTENIETACERTGTAYLRVVRQESRRLEEEETITYVKASGKRWNIWKKPVEIFWLPPGAKNCLPIRH